MDARVAAERAIIAGAGGAGLLHAVTYRAAGVRIAAVFDPDLARAAAFVSITGGVVATSLAELAAFDADYASITSPPFAHVDQALIAQRPSRIVFVEKPVATTLDDLARIEALGSCVPVVQWRAGRGLAIVRHAIEEGLLGARLHIDAELAWRRDASYFTSGHVSRARWGCGVLLSLGIHAVDIVCLLAREPIVHVTGSLARSARLPAWIDVETTAEIELDFAGGSRARVRTSIDGGDGTTRLTIAGERGVRCSLVGSETDPTSAMAAWSGLDARDAARVERIERAAATANEGGTAAPLLVPFLHAAIAARRAGASPGETPQLPGIADVAAAHQAVLALYRELDRQTEDLQAVAGRRPIPKIPSPPSVGSVPTSSRPAFSNEVRKRASSKRP
jgi:predicted dehydrogenase